MTMVLDFPSIAMLRFWSAMQDITIFIPTFRRPELLEKSIKSALNQTYKNICVVVSDNASGDETAAVVKRIEDPRLHYICHSQNLGMLGNYQYGLDTIKTKYFSFLSDDDQLLPEFCETAINGFLRFPDSAFFACSTVVLCKERGVLAIPLQKWPREGQFLPHESLPEMISNKYPVPTTVLFQREYANKAHIDFQNQVMWDCDFLIQLASQFPIAISKKECGIFLHHAGSFSGDKDFHEPLQKLGKRMDGFGWMSKPLKYSAQRALKAHIYSTLVQSVLSKLSRKQMEDARVLAHLLLTQFPLRMMSIIAFLAVHFASIFPAMHTVFTLLKKARLYFRVGSHLCHRKKFFSLK